MKTCARCHFPRPFSDFHRDCTSKDGHKSYCKPCNEIYRVEYRKRYPTRQRSSRLKYDYGITVEQYDAMLKKQNHVCAICNTFPPGKRLAVDHNHETGKIRGLLCANCNAGLGWFKENTSRLNAAILYLETSVL